MFFAAVLLGFAVCAGSKALAPADLVMPLVATAFIALAVVSGLIAWFARGDGRQELTYTDVAGALMLIGAFAAAAIEPDQMVRLVESR